MSSKSSARLISDKFVAVFTVTIIKTVGLLPLAPARALGSALGWLGWVLRSDLAKVTLRNLELCFQDMPRQERKRLARRSMMETGCLAIEICVLQRRDLAWVNRHMLAVHGEDELRAAIAAGRGMILLAPHIGNWEVLSLTLPSYGKLTALYQPPKQIYLEPLIKAAREKTGATLVPTNRRGIVKLLASLKAGGITAVLPDQNPNKGNGAFSPFFGLPAYTMTTVHGFVQRTECPVFMGMVKRVKGGFETFFFPAPEGINSEDQATSLAALNQGVEQTIAIAPAQYQWEYKRFKRRPEGEANRYESL